MSGIKDFREILFNHENDITKEDALKLCRDHMSGQWEKIGTDDLDLSVIQ